MDNFLPNSTKASYFKRHHILIKKLEMMEVHGPALNIIKSYPSCVTAVKIVAYVDSTSDRIQTILTTTLTTIYCQILTGY